MSLQIHVQSDVRYTGPEKVVPCRLSPAIIYRVSYQIKFWEIAAELKELDATHGFKCSH